LYSFPNFAVLGRQYLEFINLKKVIFIINTHIWKKMVAAMLGVTDSPR
jgi:hypothetical protein